MNLDKFLDEFKKLTKKLKFEVQIDGSIRAIAKVSGKYTTYYRNKDDSLVFCPLTGVYFDTCKEFAPTWAAAIACTNLKIDYKLMDEIINAADNPKENNIRPKLLEIINGK